MKTLNVSVVQMTCLDGQVDTRGLTKQYIK